MDLAGVTIAFDLDGTLVDTAPDLIGALNVVLGERRLPTLSIDSARELVGQGARGLLMRGFAAAGEPLEEAEIAGLTTRFIQAYRARIASESRVFPGLEPALDALSQAGAILTVCTNKRTDLSLELLDALGLTHRFTAVVGVDLAPMRKPHPSHFVAAIKAAGGDPSRALMVGDSANDVDSAKAAGAPVIVVSFGYTDTPPDQLGADVLIDRFDELPAAAARLVAARRLSTIYPAASEAPVVLRGRAASAIGSRS